MPACLTACLARQRPDRAGELEAQLWPRRPATKRRPTACSRGRRRAVARPPSRLPVCAVGSAEGRKQPIGLELGVRFAITLTARESSPASASARTRLVGASRAWQRRRWRPFHIRLLAGASRVLAWPGARQPAHVIFCPLPPPPPPKAHCARRLGSTGGGGGDGCCWRCVLAPELQLASVRLAPKAAQRPMIARRATS